MVGGAKRLVADATRFLVSCLVAGLATQTAFADATYASRFVGNWSGTGHTRTNIDGTPTNVRCEAAGTFEGAELTIEGRCWAFGLFSRAFGARIAYDAATDAYSGTYVGSRSGDSLLRGRGALDVLSLDVTWPRIINGDDRANMILRNGGEGRFRLDVEDTELTTGAVVTITSIEFQRQP